MHPQLVELLHGLMRNWKIMSVSHETQKRIMSELKFLNWSSYGKFSNESHQLATQKLEAELQNWRACIVEYVSSQMSYIEALHGWLHKFVTPETESYTGAWFSLRPSKVNMILSLEICHNWLVCLDKLPDKDVTCAMKSFGKDVQALMVQQGKEHQQKRKVDGLARKYPRKVLAFEIMKSILQLKFFEKEMKLHAQKGLTKMENELRGDGETSYQHEGHTKYYCEWISEGVFVSF